MTISRVENACKPLILQGLQKNIEKISTHLLIMLTNGAKIQSNKGKVLKEKKAPVPASEKRTTTPSEFSDRADSNM